MAQTAMTRKSGRNWFFGCLLVLVLLLILLGIGGGLAITQLQPPDVLGLQVNVRAPQSGELAEVNRPISVNASASYSAGLTRLELYVDGALVAAQEPQSPANASALNLVRNWLPKTTGRHILIARAYGRDNAKADSPIAYVDVVKLLDSTAQVTLRDIPQIPGTGRPTLNQLSQGLNIPLSQLQTANPGLNGTNPDDPLPLDTPLDVPRSSAPAPAPDTPDVSTPGDDPGAVSPVPLPGTPAAPTDVNVVADCTTAQLTWTDSPDEEQYVIYRLGPSDLTLNLIATLPQNSTSFRDTLTELGDYRYQVAAVRGGVEGLSLMAAANTPDTCVPPAVAPSGTTDLVLSLIELQTDTPYDRVYCYLQVDGGSYERVPTGDFAYLTTDASDSHHLSYDLGRQPAGLVPNRGEIPLPTHLADAPVTLNADCLGGGASIGTLSLSIPREQWDGTIREANSTHWHLRYRIGANSRVYLRDDLARLLGNVRVDPSIIIPRPRPDPDFFRLPCYTCDPLLPRPRITRIAWGHDACTDIFPSDTMTTRVQETAFVGCLWLGAQTAYWEFPNSLPPGITAIDPLGYLVHAEAMNVTTRGTNLIWDKHVSPGSHLATLVPTPPCNSAIRYSVSALVRVNGVFREQTEWSTDYTVVNTNPCAVELTVTFDRLTIGPFHHPCFPFCPAVPSVPSTIQLWAGRTSDQYGTLLTQLPNSNSNDSGSIWMGEGTRDLAQEFFRRDDGLADWVNPWWYTDHYESSGRNHNTVSVFLDERSRTQGIRINGVIKDRSWYPFSGALSRGLSAFPYCDVVINLDARPLNQWVGADIPFDVRTGPYQDYTDFCEYTGHVTGRALSGDRF